MSRFSLPLVVPIAISDYFLASVLIPAYFARSMTPPMSPAYPYHCFDNGNIASGLQANKTSMPKRRPDLSFPRLPCPPSCFYPSRSIQLGSSLFQRSLYHYRVLFIASSVSFEDMPSHPEFHVLRMHQMGSECSWLKETARCTWERLPMRYGSCSDSQRVVSHLLSDQDRMHFSSAFDTSSCLCWIT